MLVRCSFGCVKSKLISFRTLNLSHGKLPPRFQPTDSPHSSIRIELTHDLLDVSGIELEVEYDGKVQIRGQTTSGGRTVVRNSRVFQMKVRQLCPPGPFTVFFKLPGPVDPRLFQGNFRTDGIFEGIIVKIEDLD